ncbi:hypothetical protein FB451DRAFT_1277233 [Mycena latifolia]|nr:hypothetical protein FB451DRAFT_1277233 [Mycena latifolia]
MSWRSWGLVRSVWCVPFRSFFLSSYFSSQAGFCRRCVWRVGARISALRLSFTSRAPQRVPRLSYRRSRLDPGSLLSLRARRAPAHPRAAVSLVGDTLRTPHAFSRKRVLKLTCSSSHILTAAHRHAPDRLTPREATLVARSAYVSTQSNAAWVAYSLRPRSSSSTSFYRAAVLSCVGLFIPPFISSHLSPCSVLPVSLTAFFIIIP